MIKEVESCQKCPLCNNDNEYGYDSCNYPNSDIQTQRFEQLPSDKIHEKCPLKVVDLILTVKK